MPFAQPQNSLGPRIRGAADVIFVIDSTGSMGPIIDGIKSNVRTFVEGLDGGGQTPMDWRLWVVGYRDVKEDSAQYAFINLDAGFVDTVEAAVAQLDALEAAGGGDEPESLLDVLFKIAEANRWPRGDADAQRVIAIFTDASAKPEMDPSTTGGDRSVNRVIKELALQRAKLFIFGPSGDPVLNALTAIYPTKSIYYQLGGSYDEVTETLTKQGFADVLGQMGATVSAGAINVLDAGSSGVGGIV